MNYTDLADTRFLIGSTKISDTRIYVVKEHSSNATCTVFELNGFVCLTQNSVSEGVTVVEIFSVFRVLNTIKTKLLHQSLEFGDIFDSKSLKTQSDMK